MLYYMGLEKTRLALLYFSSAHLVHPDPCKQNLGLRICGYVGCSQKKIYANTNTTQKHAQHAHTMQNMIPTCVCVCVRVSMCVCVCVCVCV
jgi:hypothetical protein